MQGGRQSEGLRQDLHLHLYPADIAQVEGVGEASSGLVTLQLPLGSLAGSFAAKSLAVVVAIDVLAEENYFLVALLRGISPRLL